MISKFRVDNFRLFDTLEIKNLSRVNLIVGKNSAGKSALLEAFLLYFSHMSPDLFVDLLYSRQEHFESSQNRFSRRNIASPIRHLFRGHRVPELFDEGFRLSSEQNSIHVKIAAYILEDSEKNITRRFVNIDELDSYDPDFLDRYLIKEENSVSKILFPLDSEIRDIKRRGIRQRREKANSVAYQFVSTNGITDSKASLLWDSISLTDLENEVVKGIQLVEPNALGITFVENGERHSSESRIPLVKLSNIDEPVPLKSLGDGLSRIFQIVLSLVCAKDGVLIVDEFENGLHWSIQKSVWDIVFNLASRLNVQIFCSTHSRDCISGFQSVWANHEDKASFIRITKTNGIATIKEYDLELLSDSIETEVEVR